MRRLNSTEQPEPSSSPGDESPVCGLLAALDEAATLRSMIGDALDGGGSEQTAW